MRDTEGALTSRGRLVLALLWLASLRVAGWFVSQHLQLSGDLRKFVPRRVRTRRATQSRAAAAADDTRWLVLA